MVSREEPRNRRRAVPLATALHGFSSIFTRFFALFSLIPATPRRPAEEPRERSAARSPNRIFHKFMLALSFLFVALALVSSSALVVYTAWLHDLENGVFALLFAVLSAQIAMNWLRWKNERDPEEEPI